MTDVFAVVQDGHQHDGGFMQLGPTNLGDLSGTGMQWIGLRFEVDLDGSETILDARVDLTVSAAHGGNLVGAWAFEQVDDAAAMTTTSGNLSGRSWPSDSEQFAPQSDTGLGGAGTTISSPSLAGLLTEIVQRGGWQQGNHVLVAFVQNPAMSDRTIAAGLGHSTLDPPKLRVTTQTVIPEPPGGVVPLDAVVSGEWQSHAPGVFDPAQAGQRVPAGHQLGDWWAAVTKVTRVSPTPDGTGLLVQAFHDGRWSPPALFTPFPSLRFAGWTVGEDTGEHITLIGRTSGGGQVTVRGARGDRWIGWSDTGRDGPVGVCFWSRTVNTDTAGLVRGDDGLFRPAVASAAVEVATHDGVCVETGWNDDVFRAGLSVLPAGVNGIDDDELLRDQWMAAVSGLRRVVR